MAPKRAKLDVDVEGAAIGQRSPGERARSFGLETRPVVDEDELQDRRHAEGEDDGGRELRGDAHRGSVRANRASPTRVRVANPKRQDLTPG
jgi:hypothetical protein